MTSPRPVTPSPEPLNWSARRKPDDPFPEPTLPEVEQMLRRGLDPMMVYALRPTGDPFAGWAKAILGSAHPAAPDHRLRDVLERIEAAFGRHRNGILGPTMLSSVFHDTIEDLRAVLSEATPSSEPVLDVDVVAIGEAATSALDELDNIRWDDIWEALAIAERPDLAEWTRSYVGYVRADIEKVIAELTLSELDDRIVLLTVDEAAVLLGMSSESVHRIAKSDLIRSFVISKSVMLDLNDVREYDRSTPIPLKKRKARGRKAIASRLRFRILERDGFRCAYCGATAKDARLAVDHVVSVADGGTDDDTNLVAACEECNLGKGRRSLTVIA